MRISCLGSDSCREIYWGHSSLFIYRCNSNIFLAVPNWEFGTAVATPYFLSLFYLAQLLFSNAVQIILYSQELYRWNSCAIPGLSTAHCRVFLLFFSMTALSGEWPIFIILWHSDRKPTERRPDSRTAPRAVECGDGVVQSVQLYVPFVRKCCVSLKSTHDCSSKDSNSLISNLWKLCWAIFPSDWYRVDPAKIF